jgi:uncharacterized membrane protein YbhN (UPF0104 family)
VTRSVWAWLRLLGGASIIVVLLWRVGTGAFLEGLRIIDAPALLAAFAIGVATTAFSAWRWCLVARGLGLRLSMRSAMADYYKALFLNAALPGGVLGDVDRAVQHGRDEGDVGRSVRAVVLERTAGQIVLVSVGLVVLLTVPSPVLNQLERHSAAAGVAALSAGAVGAAAFAAWVRLRRGTSRAAGAARTGAAEIRTALLSRRNWPGIVIASTAVLAGHLATFVVAARAAGSTASLLRLAPLMLLALLAMSLPVNVGGWGPREGVTAWAFGAAGLSATQGLTIAVAYGLFAFVAALPGAVVLLLRAESRVRAARSATVEPILREATMARVPITAGPVLARPAIAETVAPEMPGPVVPEPILRPLPVRVLVRQGA